MVVRRKQGLDATDVIRRSPRLARAIGAIESGGSRPAIPPALNRSAMRCAISTITW